jgi:hypothetical protein
MCVGIGGCWPFVRPVKVYLVMASLDYHAHHTIILLLVNPGIAIIIMMSLLV